MLLWLVKLVLLLLLLLTEWLICLCTFQCCIVRVLNVLDSCKVRSSRNMLMRTVSNMCADSSSILESGCSARPDTLLQISLCPLSSGIVLTLFIVVASLRIYFAGFILFLVSKSSGGISHDEWGIGYVLVLVKLLLSQVTMVYQTICKAEEEVIISSPLIRIIGLWMLLYWTDNSTPLDSGFAVDFIVKAANFVITFHILNIWKLAFIYLLRLWVNIVVVYLLKGHTPSMRVASHRLSKLFCEENVDDHVPVYVLGHRHYSAFHFFVWKCYVALILVVFVPWLKWKEILYLLESLCKVSIINMLLLVLVERL